MVGAPTERARMSNLRVGTRGSDLALTQTRWFCARLAEAHPSIRIEEIIIKTHGDIAAHQPLGASMPVGVFVTAIECALFEERIDFAIHSYKDLQTAVTEGLVVAAIPEREVVHDVLLTREPLENLGRLRPGFRVGTSSPRRAAQFRRLGDVEVVAIRGNVATRVGKLESEQLDGVVLAAAGLKRLGICHPYVTALPTDRFVPSPAQGALAVQVRQNSPAERLIQVMDHAVSRRAVEAERSFLRAIGAGCHTPVGALAQIDGNKLTLYGQLFSDDGTRCVEGAETDALNALGVAGDVGKGEAGMGVGERLAGRLLEELGADR